MTIQQFRKTFGRLRGPAFVAASCLTIGGHAMAASFATPTTFATGGAASATQPDSVTYGGGSLWVEYGNGASSRDYSGSGTIVQYSTAGAVQNTYTIAGSVDGLKYNGNTGQVWALQNQDANSRLTIINPMTQTTTSYSYGPPYTGASGTRGFDDVAFVGNNVYLSETNPGSTSDPVVVKLANANPASPIQTSTVQTGAGITATDPDSLKSAPNGGLVLSAEHDGTLTFINNPGQAGQTANTVKLITASGSAAGSPDDSLYATAASGTFYIADTGANSVFAIHATGLNANSSLFVDAGNSFGSVDPATGVFTPIYTGTSPHGMDFVPDVTATPEPSTLGISFVGLAVCGLFFARRRFVN